MLPKKITGMLGGLPVGDERGISIIGVINLTKNSFYVGSVRKTPDEIAAAAMQMRDDGADIIDVGARSTAPYRKYDIPKETEAKVLSTAIHIIKGKVDLPVSCDTTRIEPARAAFKEGATILNDAYGLTQKDAAQLARLVSSKDGSIIITAHESRRKSELGPLLRVKNALAAAIELGEAEGIEPSKVVVDPGIGFFADKRITNVEWNCIVLDRLQELRAFSRPICVGVSRKRFIGKVLGDKPPELRLIGSLSVTAIAVYNGAHIIRTHDVQQTVEAAKLAYAIREKGLSHVSSSPGA